MDADGSSWMRWREFEGSVVGERRRSGPAGMAAIGPLKILGFLILQSLKALAFMRILIGRGGWRGNEQGGVA